jgi:hypothetical protein
VQVSEDKTYENETVVQLKPKKRKEKKKWKTYKNILN